MSMKPSASRRSGLTSGTTHQRLTASVNRLQYSRLARYSLRNTPYCAQSLLFASSATGSAHKRSPSLFANANRDDKLRYTFTPCEVISNSEFRIPNSELLTNKTHPSAVFYAFSKLQPCVLKGSDNLVCSCINDT